MKIHSKGIAVMLFLVLSLTIYVFFFISLPVNAHSGRTDSSGGHYDDGDYHYHHGYPAHDHYDIDGDGVRDCPYRFDDETGSNSGTSKGGNDVTSTTDKEVADVPTWVYWIFALQFVIAFAAGFIIRGRRSNNQIEELYRKHNETEKKLKSTIEALQKYIKDAVIQRQKKEEDAAASERAKDAAKYPAHVKVNFRDPNPFSLFDDFNNDDDPFSLPPGVMIEKGAFLSLGYKSSMFPYGKYTVFTRSNSDVYHTLPSCRGHYSLSPTYIMSVLETRRPCAYCGHRLQGNQKYPRWYVNFKNATIKLDIEW